MKNQPHHLSLKTHFFNFLRGFFKNPLGEKILRSFTQGKESSSFFSKFTPNYYQYSPNSIRYIKNKDGISFALDISDIIDWFIYFGFSEPSKEMLLSKAKGSPTIMDIGANVGEISLRLALDQSSEIYSFEPDPINFDHFALQTPFHHQHELTKSFGSFEKYLEWRVNEDIHLQKDFVTNKNGEIIVDFVGHLENIQNDFRKICTLVKLPNIPLPHSNSSNRRTSEKYYSAYTSGLIEKHFAPDIELFGYSRPF